MPMDDEVRRRLEQMYKITVEGQFGAAAQQAAHELGNERDKVAIALKLIHDFYTPRATEGDTQLAEIADLFGRLLMVIYRDARQQDLQVGEGIANSFIADFPGTTGTGLYSRWEGLARASYVFRTVHSTNAFLVWEQAKRLVQTYNEFLNGLLGHLLIGWRCALGKSYSVNTFGNAYGAKLNEFSTLTNGEDGAFYLILRLAKPKLRNALAHESIWLDQESSTVRFTDGQPPISYEMSLDEFMALAAAGSHHPRAYLIALAAIVVWEAGTPLQRLQLPNHLVSLFSNRRQS